MRLGGNYLNKKDENGGSQIGRGFPVEDQSKLTHAYTALCTENHNILFIGDDEDHLDHVFVEFYNAIKEDGGLFTHRLLSPTMEEFTALMNKLVDQVTIEQALVNELQLRHVIFVPDVVRETQAEWAACESALSAIPGVQVRMVSCARRTALDLKSLYPLLKKSACEIIFFDESPSYESFGTKREEDTEERACSVNIHESSSEQMPVWDRSSENTNVSLDLVESKSLAARVISFASKPSIVFLMTFNLVLLVLWWEYIVLPDVMSDFVLKGGEILLDLWNTYVVELVNR